MPRRAEGWERAGPPAQAQRPRARRPGSRARHAGWAERAEGATRDRARRLAGPRLRRPPAAGARPVRARAPFARASCSAPTVAPQAPAAARRAPAGARCASARAQRAGERQCWWGQQSRWGKQSRWGQPEPGRPRWGQPRLPLPATLAGAGKRRSSGRARAGPRGRRLSRRCSPGSLDGSAFGHRPVAMGSGRRGRSRERGYRAFRQVDEQSDDEGPVARRRAAEGS